MTSVAAAVRLDDEALLAGFESAALEPGNFHHEEHVRVAWLYFQRHEPAVALARFETHIRKLVTALGAADKYHETILGPTCCSFVSARSVASPGVNLPPGRRICSTPGVRFCVASTRLNCWRVIVRGHGSCFRTASVETTPEP